MFCWGDMLLVFQLDTVMDERVGKCDLCVMSGFAGVQEKDKGGLKVGIPGTFHLASGVPCRKPPDRQGQ